MKNKDENDVLKTLSCDSAKKYTNERKYSLSQTQYKTILLKFVMMYVSSQVKVALINIRMPAKKGYYNA